MNYFEQSYQIIHPPEPAMEWANYAQKAADGLSALLDSGECQEFKYQNYLELHPAMLPWVYGTFGRGHHGLFHGAVITQPRLVGLAPKQPDFLMIARDSGSTYAVMIEIESPCKEWFTRSGQPTAKLTQAINQLRQWKVWFAQPENVIKFQEEFGVPERFRETRRFEQRYILIYGRRSELVASGFAAMRSQHQQADERFITYDHLCPSEELVDAITATVNGKGYRAVYVPPTVRLGPFQAIDHATICEKPVAADRTPGMSRVRAAFLAERWPYWDNWAQQGHRSYGFEVE